MGKLERGRGRGRGGVGSWEECGLWKLGFWGVGISNSEIFPGGGYGEERGFGGKGGVYSFEVSDTGKETVDFSRVYGGICY